MSLDIWSHQGPRKPSSCATFMINPHWGRAATGKKSLVPICTGRFSSVQLIVTLWTVACQASLSGSGGSLGKNTGAYLPILVVIPF